MEELSELDREILDSIPVETLIQYLESRLSIDRSLPRGPEDGIYYLPGPEYKDSWPPGIKQYQQGALQIAPHGGGGVFLESKGEGQALCLVRGRCAYLKAEDGWVKQPAPSKGVLR